MSKNPRLLLLKSTIPPGARWITVHGGNGEGQPVLIQPNPDGSSTVIGGAGGAMNHLRLRAVKSESQYKEESRQKKADAAKARQEKAAKDKEAGIHESKQKARAAVKAQKQKAEKEFIGTVADALGWSKKDVEFDAEAHKSLSPAARTKLEAQHHRELLKRAREAVGAHREQLVNDSAARLQAGIGEIPVTADDPDILTVQDLDPVPQVSDGLGYATNYKKRAEKNGLTQQELQAEVAQARADRLAQMTDGQREAAIRRGDTARMVREELKNIREPIAPALKDTVLTDAQKSVDLMRAEKALKQVQEQARKARAEIDSADSQVEPKAYVIEYTADPDADAKIAHDVENDLRTMQTRAFLSEVGQIAGGDPHETLGKHVGVGAFNSINSLALAVSGSALVDRSVVDVLGIAGAAQVLARRIHTDMPDDVERIQQGVQDFHMHHYMESSAEAMGRSRELLEAAKAIELGEGKTGHDLQTAQELNDRRRSAVGEAQKILGQAYGEMEANAALSYALKQGKKDKVEVSLGKIDAENAIRQVRALGLQRGDYHLENVAGETFLTVHGAGLDRLAQPINRADIEQVKRNLDIINGGQDEDDWLPLGVANRPDLAMNVPPGVAPRIAEPFAPGADLEQSLRDYIGGRAADGDAPGDIVADIQSADFFHKVGAARAGDYRAALDAVAPLRGEDGNMRRAEDLADKFDEYADQFVKARHGATRAPLNRQKFDVDQKAVDALHRALANTPEGVAAYKQIGDLTPHDQRGLREFFYRNVARESAEAGEMRQTLERLAANEPERTTTDMFGEEAENPEWSEWKQQRDELAGKLSASSLDWPKYVDTMGGNARAYEAIQDLVKSRVSESFADSYNRLNPGKPIKVGKAVVRNNLSHLDATDPEAREQRAARERELVDSLRERAQGRYASGSVSDKLDAAREQREAFEQSQMGFFSADEPDMFGDEAPIPDRKLEADERHTIGHEAERQIAGMMGVVGQNFKPGRPTKMWNVSMSGKYVNQQRAIKMLAANKRMGLAFGAGSGKTNIMLGAHAHLSGLGKVKRSVMLVPSIVQGQFSGEALRLLEPGKFKWHIEPGADQASRIAAYKDPDTHICVMTHQSFRGDMVHLGAQHAGIDENEMTDRLSKMEPDARREWIKGVMEREGIHFDASFVDEAHDTLNRAGKENSTLANVTDALAAHTPYYTYASGESGFKNDTSEVFSMLQKLDPQRYTDRVAFMRRYGADTIASKDALQREMARYTFPASITPDVEAKKRTERVDLTPAQHQAMTDLSANLAAARIARMRGKVNVDAMKAISPGSFDGVPDEKHEEIAAGLQKSLGILKSTAMQRIIDTHPDNAKVNRIAELVRERGNKQGVVFARNRAAVEALRARLEKEGKRVVTITGADGPAEKDRKRQLFNPEKGEAQADILIASDAGAVGMNLQSGEYLIQHDIPATAKTHAQRNARIHRLGQTRNVELIDMQANHPEETKARERLEKKYGMRELMSSSLEGLDDTGVAYFLKQRMAEKPGEDTLF
ncbi:helicase-related protein [Paraburkholderia phenoliruptrix]|uniref:helicase-related protein n=1 Tax=Paraburkholderia phenoliruptrix TaxID=252970 RepID=UPI0034CE8723